MMSLKNLKHIVVKVKNEKMFDGNYLVDSNDVFDDRFCGGLDMQSRRLQEREVFKDRVLTENETDLLEAEGLSFEERIKVSDSFHDGKVYEKRWYRWVASSETSGSWVPVIYATMKESYAQSNLVYYAPNHIAKNRDLGLIQRQTGTYYNNESKLYELAKNVNPNSPMVYPFNTGTVENFKHPDKFTY